MTEDRAALDAFETEYYEALAGSATEEEMEPAQREADRTHLPFCSVNLGELCDCGLFELVREV